MATTTPIDPAALYRVDLAATIKVGRNTSVHPGANVKLRGDVIAALIAAKPDAIKSYEPVG